jgi:predicted nuclease with TOPRIM domain
MIPYCVVYMSICVSLAVASACFLKGMSAKLNDNRRRKIIAELSKDLEHSRGAYRVEVDRSSLLLEKYRSSQRECNKISNRLKRSVEWNRGQFTALRKLKEQSALDHQFANEQKRIIELQRDSISSLNRQILNLTGDPALMEDPMPLGDNQ